MKKTLVENILKKATNFQQVQIHTPEVKKLELQVPPKEFYTQQFFDQKKSEITINEIIEENMKYHQLDENSAFDDQMPYDMHYPYLHNMKVNRDINLVLAEAYFQQQKPSAAVLGSQVAARYVRYVQDLNYDPIGCDSKRNFVSFTNYILGLNQLSSNSLYNQDQFEFLAGKKFDLLDIEVNVRKPFFMAQPALKAMNDGGLLIYTILEMIPNTMQVGKQLKQQLNLFTNNIKCNSEIIIQSTIAKFEEIAHDFNKHIEVLHVQPTSNQIGHLTLYLSVRDGKKDLNHFHPYCNTCGKHQAGCEKQNFCNLSGVGPVRANFFPFNKEFLQKCLKIEKYTNQPFINKLLNQITSIPDDAYPFFINDFTTLQNSFTFYQMLGNDQGYFVGQSPMHNMPTIYTNMPWKILMGKVHSFMSDMQVEPNKYVSQFPKQELIQNNIEQAARIHYNEFVKLQRIPRVLKVKRQEQHSWFSS